MSLPAVRRPAPAGRAWRGLNVQIDRFRIWYKITWQRGRILATRNPVWESYDRFLGAPEEFYRPSASPVVRTEPSGRLGRAAVVRFSFPTLHPLPFDESNVAIGRLYLPRGIERPPVVLVSHGWAHRSWRGVEHLYVRPFLRAGFAVAFVAHPLHLDRTPRDTYSGELLVSGDVVLTVEGFRQGVADLLGTAGWLRASGYRRVGLFGYSLGGYLAGILAALRGDWDYLVLGGTGDSLVSPILDTPLGRNVREDLSACGMLDRTRLSRAWRIISPGALPRRVPADRVLMVAGRFDRIMLPVSVRRLWRAWDRPRLDWMPRGHYTLLATNRGLLQRALPFMRERSGSPGDTASPREPVGV